MNSFHRLKPSKLRAAVSASFSKRKGSRRMSNLLPFWSELEAQATSAGLAVRLRMNRLLAPVVETGEETKKTTENTTEKPAEAAQKPTQEAGEQAEERS